VANTILLKRSSTGGSVPATADGSLGELIINTNDGRLYTKINNGSASIVDLTQNDKITLSGDATGTSTNPAAGLNYSNLAITLASVNSNTGTWGGANGQIPYVTVNAKGLVTAAGNIAVSTVAVTNAANTSEITANATVGTVGFSLTTTGVSAGTYGSGTSVPTIVVDSKGRITSVTTNTISTSFSLSGTSGTGTLAGGGTLTFAGSYGVTASVSSSTITIATPQDLQTTASPSFTGLTVNGTNIDANLGTATTNITTLFSNAATQATSITTLFGNAATQATSINTLDANLGTATTNITTLFGNAATQATSINTLDANLGTATTNITTLFGNAATQATSINTLNANIGAFQSYANTNLSSTSVTAGEITISGNSISSTNAVISIDPSTAGVGGTVVIAGNLQVTGTTTTVNSTTVEVSDLNLTLAKDATNDAAANGAGITVKGANDKTISYASSGDKWTMNKPLDITGGLTTSANTAINSTLYAQGVYDNSNRVLTTASSFSNSGGDASVSGAYNTLSLTLATVNTNVGTYGNATYSARVTVNAKGLITAVTESKITPAFADITSTPTTLSGYGITDALSTSSTIDGGTY
jgi:hypothetical protein